MHPLASRRGFTGTCMLPDQALLDRVMAEKAALAASCTALGSEVCLLH